MAFKGKIVAELEVKASANALHDLFASKPHHASNVIPKHIQGCELHEGEFGKSGSIVTWNYTADGKACVTKCVMENIDTEKKTITFRIIGGDLAQEFKSFVVHMHIVPSQKEEEGCCDTVKWVVEYEKIHEDAPFPTHILDLIFNITKDVEAHHLNSS